MSELTFDERMDNLESLFVKIYNETQKLRTELELDAVVTEVFDELEDLENRIVALQHNLEMVKEIISQTNG